MLDAKALANSRCMAASLKILVVDDEPSITQSMRFIFEQPRYELSSAQDGDDALAQVEAGPDRYDVVITDNNMPRLSGVELVRELRERSFGGKIMVLSAHLSSEIRKAYQQMDVDVMIEKPFDIGELRRVLDSLAA
jgi:DNA-binding response OmpR family regulator